MLLADPVLQTTLGTRRPDRTGKVRDIYDFGDRLLIVATDRISAFDYILGSGIPDKGKVLTQISRFWFERMKPVVPNHIISMDPAEYPEEANASAALFSCRTTTSSSSEATQFASMNVIASARRRWHYPEHNHANEAHLSRSCGRRGLGIRTTDDPAGRRDNGGQKIGRRRPIAGHAPAPAANSSAVEIDTNSSRVRFASPRGR